MSLTHFLSISEFDTATLSHILEEAMFLKRALKNGEQKRLLEGKSLAMIFQKPSNRTRLSFELSMMQLGGHAVNIKDEEIQMGIREPIEDIARVTSRYVDFVMIRAIHHKDIALFANYSSVPVINGLSDFSHPCQAMADLLTIKETFGDLSGLTVTYIGDGNNVCCSLIEICAAFDISIRVCTPEGYEPNTTVPFQLERSPSIAAKDAHVIYTDTWTSMGQEQEAKKRRADFQGYTIDSNVMRKAAPNAIFLHCLPAHRGEEVSADVMESNQSKIFDQAENRLHAQKAILTFLGGVDVRK